MKYYLFEESNDYGCGYTIGCGKRLREIPGATSMKDAIQIVTEYRESEYGDDESLIATHGACELRPDKVKILAVSEEFIIDIQALRADHQAHRDKAEAAEKENEEREQFEKLKAKYGVSS